MCSFTCSFMKEGQGDYEVTEVRQDGGTVEETLFGKIMNSLCLRTYQYFWFYRRNI